VRSGLALFSLGALVALGAVATATGARADDDPPTPSDRDGIWITAGPLAGGLHLRGDWLSAVGGEVSVARVREHRTLAALGIDVGGVSYAGRNGGRLWLELEAAIHDPLPVAIGLSVGPAFETGQGGIAHTGAQATLWFYLAVIPYVRVGTLPDSGNFVETGLMFKIPAHRFP
jgi:hypothetical protein